MARYWITRSSCTVVVIARRTTIPTTRLFWPVASSLVLKHGRFLKQDSKIPLSNAFVSMLHCLGVEQNSFADSTGEMSELTQNPSS